MNFNMMIIPKYTLLNFVALGAFESWWLLFNTLPQRHQDTKVSQRYSQETYKTVNQLLITNDFDAKHQ